MTITVPDGAPPLAVGMVSMAPGAPQLAVRMSFRFPGAPQLAVGMVLTAPIQASTPSINSGTSKILR